MKRDNSNADARHDKSIFEIPHKTGTGVENTLKISNLVYYFLYETSTNTNSQNGMKIRLDVSSELANSL
jgi:hypothetical protein